MFDPSLIPLVQRLDRDPEDQDAVQQIWRALSEKGEFQTLAVLAEKVASRRRSPESAAELLYRAGEVWSRELDRDERAVPLWQKVLELDPLHDAAASSLAGAFLRAGRAELAAPLQRRVLERAKDPRRKLPILEQMSVQRAESGDAEGQMAVLREIVALDLPVTATTEHRRALARLLVQRARAAQGPEGDHDAHPDVREAAGLLGSIARDGGTARGADFAAAALALWPGEERAFSILQSTLSLRHAELTTLRIKFLAANPASRMASQVRSDLADGYLAAGRIDDAIAVLAASVGDDAGAAQRLARLYERTGRHKDLAALLLTTPLPTDRAARLTLLRRRASALRAAGDRTGLLAALRAVLDEAPGDPEALPDVERDCRLRGDLTELRARLEAAASVEGVEGAQRARWLREVAQLAERADDHDGALAVLERAAALADDDERREVDSAAERILTNLERWSDLLERLSKRAHTAADTAERKRLWMRWIEVLRERQPDPAREAAVLRGLVADDPHDGALALALADAQRRAGNAAGVEEALRELVQRASPENAGMRWSQLAGHLEQSGNVTAALDAWRNARTVDPSQAMAWAAEERLLEQSGEPRALLDVLVLHAGHPTAAGRRAGDLYQRAALLARDLGLHTEAASLAGRALTFLPDDPTLLALAQGAAEPPIDDAVPASLLDDAVPASLLDEGDAAGLEHDTGEYPVAIPDETSGVFSADLPPDEANDHTPPEGMRYGDEPTASHARIDEPALEPSLDAPAPGAPLDDTFAPAVEESSEVRTRELVALAETTRAADDQAPDDEAPDALDETAAIALPEHDAFPSPVDAAPHRDAREEARDLADAPVATRSEDEAHAPIEEAHATTAEAHEAHEALDDASEVTQALRPRDSLPPAPTDDHAEASDDARAPEEPTRPLAAALRAVRATLRHEPPPPIAPLVPTAPITPIAEIAPIVPTAPVTPVAAVSDDTHTDAHDDAEELADDSILVEVDLSALDDDAPATAPPARSAETSPEPSPPTPSVPPPPRASVVPAQPPPRTPTPPAVPASQPPAAPPPPAPRETQPPVEELPSIIVDDDLLVSPPPAPEAPKPVAQPAPVPPLSGLPPPRPSSPHVVIPPQIAAQPAALPPLAPPAAPAPLPPLAGPLPPAQSAPLPPLAGPFPPSQSAPLPPLAGPLPPQQSVPLPPLTGPLPPRAAPLPPLAAPLPPLAAPNAPVVPPAAPSPSSSGADSLPFTRQFTPGASPAIPPLTSSVFVGASTPTQQPAPAPFTQQPAPFTQQPAPFTQQPALFTQQPAAPLPPLAGPAFSAQPAPLPPLAGPAFSAQPAPPLTYRPDGHAGDPFAAGGDPFAAPPAQAFVAAPQPAPFVSSGDPFASVAPQPAPVLAPQPAPVLAPQPPSYPPPPQAPVAAPSKYQKVMAAMFEQATASMRVRV